MKKPLVAACALRVTLDGDMVRLIPAGRFDAPRGAMSGAGPWFLSEDSARSIIAKAATRSTDICIDWEHQTLLSEQNGKPAPASGWVDPKSLEWRADGLYGRVDWKAAASQAIEDDTYRYLSPVFPYNEKGEVLDLLHIALTNTPAIDTAVPALAAARMAVSTSTSITPEEDNMDKAKLIAVLGIAATSTDEQIETAVAALKTSAGEVQTLRQALDLKEGEQAVDKVAALKSAAKPDLGQYVPKSVFDETQQQLAALKAGGETSEMDRLIEEGLEDGRIAGKATADWLREKGLAACRAHMADTISVAALKATQTQGKKPAAVDEPGDLSAAELAVCKNMDMSPEKFKAAKQAG